MIGLVLQGGGAKGGYHIGVWKALRELNIDIGAVTGTSVGALNGALIAQNKYKRAYDIWYNMDPRLVFSDEPEIYHQLVTKNMSIKNTSMYFDYFKRFIKQKGLDIEPLKELIAIEVDEALLRQSPVDFGLVTVSLSDWKAVELFIDDMGQGEVWDYILASAFLPGFKPQMINGKRYIDGGFHDNLPINLISQKGFKEIIAVELDVAGFIKPVKDKALNIRRISPSGDTGSLLEFDAQRSRNNITMGYLDTLRSFGRFEGTSYFLENLPDEDYFYKKVLSLTEEQIMSMARIIGYDHGYAIRMLTEIILPEICDMLGFDIDMTYKDIMVGVVEYLASAVKINRLKVYTYEALRDDVLNSCDNLKEKIFDFEDVPSVLRRHSIVQKTFKAELLMKWLEITMSK